MSWARTATARSERRGRAASAAPARQHGGLSLVSGQLGRREEGFGRGIRLARLFEQFSAHRVQRAELGELVGEPIDLSEGDLGTGGHRDGDRTVQAHDRRGASSSSAS